MGLRRIHKGSALGGVLLRNLSFLSCDDPHVECETSNGEVISPIEEEVLTMSTERS